jgi:hypothetical protein
LGPGGERIRAVGTDQGVGGWKRACGQASGGRAHYARRASQFDRSQRFTGNKDLCEEIARWRLSRSPGPSPGPFRLESLRLAAQGTSTWTKFNPSTNTLFMSGQIRSNFDAPFWGGRRKVF